MDARGILAVLRGSTARKGAVGLCDQGVISATNLATSLFLARVCANSEFGAYIMAISALLFIAGIQGALITGPMSVLGAPREGDDLKKYVTPMALAQVGFGALASLAVISLAGLSYARGGGGRTAGVLLAAGAALFFTQGREFCRRTLLMRLAAGKALALDAVSSAVQLGGVLLLWRLGGGSWEGGGAPGPGHLSAWTAVAAVGAAGAAGILFGVPLIARYMRRSLESAGETYRASWNFGRWRLLSSFGSSSANYIVVWVVGLLGGAAAAAQMEGPRLLLGPLQILIVGAFAILVPRAAQIFHSSGRRALRSFVARAGALLLAPVILYLLAIGWGPEFWLSVFFGDRFAGQAGIVRLWMARYVALLVGQSASCGLVAMKRPGALAAVVLTCGVLASVGAGAAMIWGGVFEAVAVRTGFSFVSAGTLALVFWRLSRPGAGDQDPCPSGGEQVN